MSEGRKETMKLTASYMNNLAVGVMIVGVGTPIFTSMSRGGIASYEVFFGVLAGIMSVSLHSMARRYVREIDLLPK